MRQIYLFDKKLNEFVDRTNEVAQIAVCERGYQVTFQIGKTYTYSKNNVRVYGEFEQNNEQGVPEFKWVDSMLHSADENRRLNLLNYFVQYCLHQDVVEAAGKAAKTDADAGSEPAAEEPSEEELVTPFRLLAKFIAQQNMDKDMGLWLYLNGKMKAKELPALPNWIFPFGCNGSQIMAVNKAMTLPLSIIEGPPGTGKTQTILNIIANIVSQGKTVAVVSNNNSAVQNVADKLKKEGLGWLAAGLGSVEKRTAYFESGQELISIPASWHIPPEEFKGRDERRAANIAQAKEFFDRQTRLQRSRAKLQAARHELDVYCQEHEGQLPVLKKIASRWLKQVKGSTKLRRLKVLLTSDFNAIKPYELGRIWRFFRLGLWMPNRLFKYGENALYALNLALYQWTIEELEQSIADDEIWLKRNSMQPLVSSIQSNSMVLFKDRLFALKRSVYPQAYSVLDFKMHWGPFVAQHPVVLSSTFSLVPCTPNGWKYDYLIIDEASQVNIPSAVACFAMAKQLVVVGDSRQLDKIVNTEGLLAGSRVPAEYDANVESILTSCKRLFGEGVTTLLREHYRCEPGIIEFCNQRFYNNELVVMTEAKGSFPYLLDLVAANEVRALAEGSCLNERQALETKALIDRLLAEGQDASEIGVIAPYRGHANYLRSLLGRDCPVEVDTVHRFQGREKDVIIYNAVLNRTTEFNDDPHLINVAVSRAKKRFVVVTAEEALQAADSNLASLASYIRYQDPDCQYVRTSAFASIFDVLYASEPLEGASAVARRKGESAAEVLFRGLLDVLLAEEDGKYASWRYKQEYYLIDLVRLSKDDASLHAVKRSDFSDEEWRYMLNGARLDFLLFDTMAHTPLLAIEVDGSQHELARYKNKDVMKDHILDVLGIGHQRFATNTAVGREEDRLRSLLSDLYVRRNG